MLLCSLDQKPVFFFFFFLCLLLFSFVCVFFSHIFLSVQMSGRRAGTPNWLPGHFPLLIQAVVHVKETLTDDVTADEVDKFRENAFQVRMVAAIRNGDEFVNT